MNVHHHLDNATLLRFASGDLDEAFSIVVASHLEICESCRRAARLGDEVGGRLLETGEAAELSIGAHDRLMRLLDDEREPIKVKDKVRPHRGDVPASLQRFIGASLEDVPWKTVSPGVRRHTLDLESETQSSLYLLNIAPGKAVPEHGHGGSEMTLILSGAYDDELGRFSRGDVADLDEHVEHQPKVVPGAPCICLVATEAPTRFKGFFSRLLQPFVRI